MRPPRTEGAATRLPLKDRIEAGQHLAAALRHLTGRKDLIVLALPRGGVPVAAQVARALDAPLDVLIVRKLGVPGQEELALGAIASGGVRVLNRDVVARLDLPPEAIEAAAAREQQEVERRERLYRGIRPPLDVRGRHVVLVDDGLATGATMEAAIQAVRQLAPAGVVVAVPVAPVETVQRLRGLVEAVVCLAMPEPFLGIGQWYGDFHQMSDAEVRSWLERAPAAG
jgi:predicted phosphoribosyltransferase